MGALLMTLTIVGYHHFIVSVDAQRGSCRASVNCDGSSGDVLISVTTIENCCLNTAGLAFTNGESCTPCIVFGFFEESFTGIEQGQTHVVQAGWQKGAPQAGVNLQFNVIDKGITARKGAGLDYTISTGSRSVRFLYRSPNPSSVVCIFRTDNIAQEINETLTVELVQVPGTTALPTGDHVFFRNTINMTIIDSDVVEISFTEDDFQASEAPADGATISFMPVRVTKSSRIANPIVLDVIPLTVDMARANTPPALPDNIPVNNPFSPPFADLNDFDSAAIRITFDPDEDVNDNERAAPIPIIDDLVNEADEQIFIVQLHLVNSTNSSAIDFTTRATSLCRIIDDDSIIRIGFEVAQYTYIEPMFDTTIDEFDYIPPTNLPENGPIYIAKQDNVVSEQTFLVKITATDKVPSGSGFRPVQLNSDYGGIGAPTLDGRSVVRQFPAAVQRMLFPFTLMYDNIPEGTEAFFFSISAEDEGLIDDGRIVQVPVFLSPTTLFPQAYVIIEDNDPIIIGFEETKYTVDESVGILNVYVSVSNPPMNMELFATVQLVIQSISIDATGGDDYVEINADNFDVFLTFNDLYRRLTFEVTIIDDNLFESVEDFNLELRFDPFFPVPSGVELSPNVSTVYILDDDNITLGFINPPYSVFENESLVIQVGVLEGSLQREVLIRFSTSDITAVDKNDYFRLSNLMLTFGPANVLVDIPVKINDNRFYELTEIFSAAITFPGDPVPRMILSPKSAQITIFDDDDFQILGHCHASDNCGTGQSEDLGVMTLEECCLNTQAGLSFIGRSPPEICNTCIVFGFFQDSFTGIEQGPVHTVQAGWQKGAAQARVDLVLNVINRGITAREGSNFDYTINVTQVRFLYLRPDPPDDVVVIFRMDAIAQEINETFTLELSVPDGAALPTGDHVFFRNTINMTIIDSDGVDIFFTEDSYRANEAPEEGAGPTSFMPVRVMKNLRIANPIVLDVIPLTVDMANASILSALPANVSFNNPFSPPFADLNDFNNKVIRFIFNPDENANDDEHAAPIPIIDDLVNEADEQVFIVQLHLIDSINPGAIDLTTRAASICKIINDDTIRIGFEVPQYTYIEPLYDTTIDEFNYIPPTNLPENGPIYLVKQDNVVSEQTFLIQIQTSDSVPPGSGFNQAQINVDYALGVVGTSHVLQFPTISQRILFSFTLFNDTLPEGTEAFLASSAAEDSTVVDGTRFDVPGFNPPTSVFPRTYVIIEDRNRQQTKKPGASVSSVVIAVVTCAVFVTLVTAVLVIVIIILKKKCYSKLKGETQSSGSVTEHDYESVLPSSIPLTSVSSRSVKEVDKSVGNSKKEDVTYDEIVSNKNDAYERTSFKPSDEIASIHGQAITLSKNDAYECTSFKPSDEPATDKL